MAIRQLTYEEGEDYGIRQKGRRLPNDDVIENINLFLDNDALIVKCGRSFWDVSSYPEVFLAGDVYYADGAFSSNICQDVVREPIAQGSEVLNDGEHVDEPLPAQVPFTDFIVSKGVNDSLFVRGTYYLKKEQIEAMRILSYGENVQISALAREIFDRGLMSIAEEFSYPNLFEDAKANLKRGENRKKRNCF